MPQHNVETLRCAVSGSVVIEVEQEGDDACQSLCVNRSPDRVGISSNARRGDVAIPQTINGASDGANVAHGSIKVYIHDGFPMRLSIRSVASRWRRSISSASL